MAAARLLRTSGPLGLRPPLPSSSSSSSCHFSLNSHSTLSSTATKIRNRLSNDAEKRHGGVNGLKPSSVTVATSERLILISQPPTIDFIVNLASLVTKIISTALMILKVAAKTRPRKLHVQMFIERSIIDCRFFALLAVVGSLLGSVLCFVEGCFMVIELYLQYFHVFSQRSDQGHVVHLLIEAIDMFLIGTAMLVFGMGLHFMFVASKGKGSQFPGSNLFGLFNLKTLPRWACMQSVTQAKSKMGHAVIMINASRSVGQVQECPFGYWVGPCLFRRCYIRFLDLFIPPLTTICWRHYTRQIAEKSPVFASITDQKEQILNEKSYKHIQLQRGILC